LSREPEGQFDLLVLDAFSSDSIPVHLLTQEAFELYRSRLKPGGWLLVHISNRYLDLEPVVAAAAGAIGLTCRSFEDDDPKAPGQEASHWLLLTRSDADLGPLTRSVLWKPAAVRPDVKPWTDERASLWSVWRW
jgi:spermidine synthase